MGAGPLLTCRVETNIDRDPANRQRMAACPYGGSRGRMAVSHAAVYEELAGGAAALVMWRLETGRTHQIRCVWVFFLGGGRQGGCAGDVKAGDWENTPDQVCVLGGGGGLVGLCECVSV